MLIFMGWYQGLWEFFGNGKDIMNQYRVSVGAILAHYDMLTGHAHQSYFDINSIIPGIRIPIMI